MTPLQSANRPSNYYYVSPSLRYHYPQNASIGCRVKLGRLPSYRMIGTWIVRREA
jgi:hypothetical protein